MTGAGSESLGNRASNCRANGGEIASCWMPESKNTILLLQLMGSLSLVGKPVYFQAKNGLPRGDGERMLGAQEDWQTRLTSNFPTQIH
jgi:hypothetical protein